MAHIVMPNQMTVGEWIMENAMPAIKGGTMPLMLAGPKDEPPIDAEFEEKP